MSDAERGESRAQGALDNFLKEIQNKMEDEGRSLEYIDSFWRELAKIELRDWCL